MKKLIVAGCMVLVAAGFSFAQPQDAKKNENSAKVKILDADTLKIMTIVSKAKLIFMEKTPLLETVSEGDILVAGAGPLVPDGFLKRVDKIKAEDGKIIIETTQGSWENAFKKENTKIANPDNPQGVISGGTESNPEVKAKNTQENALPPEVELSKGISKMAGGLPLELTYSGKRFGGYDIAVKGTGDQCLKQQVILVDEFSCDCAGITYKIKLNPAKSNDDTVYISVTSKPIPTY